MIVFPCLAQRPDSATTHFIHGQWFNGDRFVKEDFYSVDGLLTHHPPKQVNRTVDLHGQYVVPPYGDAHEHNFDSVKTTPAVVANYLKDGIFYAQGMTDVTHGAQAVVAAGLVNTPESIDVTYAHGGLTGVNGHPKDTYEGVPLGIYYAATEQQRQQVIAAHQRAGDAYWEIGSRIDLDTKWPQILAAKPDLIKVFLHDSGHYTPEMHLHPPLGGGLDPALVPLIVKRAHASGLKVAAHVDTEADYHTALMAGVDELAHLPGYCLSAGEDPKPYRLTDADIAATASRYVTLGPTAAQCDSARATAAGKAAVRALQLDNLRRLKAAGVNIVIGSDTYGQDSLHEANYLHALGLWNNLELLRIWSVATPKDIFPNRRITKLKEGYEASFLVLRNDPLNDWSATEEIDQRWKQGHQIELPR